ncbi:hypothetical protein RhiirA5_381198, partial [Rhizophagus irregularis]
ENDKGTSADHFLLKITQKFGKKDSHFIFFKKKDDDGKIRSVAFTKEVDKSDLTIQEKIAIDELHPNSSYSRKWADIARKISLNRKVKRRMEAQFCDRFCNSVLSVGFAVGSVSAENRSFKTETEPNRPLASLLVTKKKLQWLFNKNLKIV